MPSFLNWSSALAIASVVIPLLLLLYFLKLRRREMPVPSTLLWKKSIHDMQVNAPFQRLRRNLLLLLQLLLLLALLLALSRPVVNYAPGAGKVAVILIDRSASMSARDVSGRSRLDEAKRLASKLVDTMEKDASATVIAFDDSAEIVRSFSSDRAVLKQAIDSIRPCDRRTRLKTAFQLAEAKARAFYADRPAGPATARPEIWLYSDGRVLDSDELALSSSELKYTKVGSESAPNVAVVSLNAKRNYERPTEVQVFVRLANFGPEPRRAVLQLSVDGQVPPGGVRSDLFLLPERWTDKQREAAEATQKYAPRASAEFTLELLTSAVITVALKEQPDDVLPADDVANIVVPPPRPLGAALVSANGNLWLEKLLQAADLRNPGFLSPASYEEKMKDPQAVATAYDVILFDGWQPTTLPPAGNFIYFNVVPPGTKLTAASDAQGQIFLKEQAVLDWDHEHPILRGANPQFYAQQSLKLQLPIDAQVLIEGTKGPLVVLYREGRRTHIVASFDLQASTWPERASFPIFFDNAMQYLALGSEMDLRQSYPPGATPRIPRHNLQQAGPRLTRVQLSGPPAFGSSDISVPPTGDFALPALDRVGIYTLKPAVPQYEKLAVNLLDENESNLLPADRAPGGSGEVLSGKGAASRFDLWWWIVACGAVPLCLIEWWVYTRRMHL